MSVLKSNAQPCTRSVDCVYDFHSVDAEDERLVIFIVGFDVGCVSEARMNMAATMEQKISNGIQLLRYIMTAQSVM